MSKVIAVDDLYKDEPKKIPPKIYRPPKCTITGCLNDTMPRLCGTCPPPPFCYDHYNALK